MNNAGNEIPVGFSMSAIWLVLWGAAIVVPNAGAEDFVAVFSSASNGYERTKLPDGSFRPETYTFKEGGFLGSRISDNSIDKMEFKSIAHILADSLASKNYLPSLNPKAARLLIVVYWGTSHAPDELSKATPISQAAENIGPPTLDRRGRPPPSGTAPSQSTDALEGAVLAQAFGDKIVYEEDAMMLGYGSAKDPELKQYRYFVVLLAYDLQALLNDKKENLLWQARFSMDEHHNQFDPQLKPMVLRGLRLFRPRQLRPET